MKIGYHHLLHGTPAEGRIEFRHFEFLSRPDPDKESDEYEKGIPK